MGASQVHACREKLVEALCGGTCTLIEGEAALIKLSREALVWPKGTRDVIQLERRGSSLSYVIFRNVTYDNLDVAEFDSVMVCGIR